MLYKLKFNPEIIILTVIAGVCVLVVISGFMNLFSPDGNKWWKRLLQRIWYLIVIFLFGLYFFSNVSIVTKYASKYPKYKEMLQNAECQVVEGEVSDVENEKYRGNFTIDGVQFRYTMGCPYIGYHGGYQSLNLENGQKIRVTYIDDYDWYDGLDEDLDENPDKYIEDYRIILQVETLENK